MSANQQQIAGDHYKELAIQPWDFIVANRLGYIEGNIVKYVTRYSSKNGATDLLKARHYLDKLIETVMNEELDKPNPAASVSVELKTVIKPIKRGRGGPRKAPYGYRKDGKPFKRPPVGWVGEAK